jgi:hypothetical protein
MLNRSHKLKLQVFLNAIDITKYVTGGSITKGDEISTASIQLSNKSGQFYNYFRGRDIFYIYVGKDALPVVHNFSGYVVDCNGESSLELSLVGILNSCEKEYIYINDYDNYSGFEVSRAIEKQLTDMDMAGYISKHIQGTNPSIFIPNDYRKPEGITRYDFIKFARNLAYSVNETTGEVLSYQLYCHGSTFHFLKQKPMVDGQQDWTFTYADNLITCLPTTKTLGIINRQTVFSKTGEKVVFDLVNDQRVAINGIMEGSPIKLDYGTVEDAFNRARKECLMNRAPVVNTQISSLDLIDAIPNYSYVKIIGAPNMTNGLHRIVKTRIDFTGGLRVVCDLVKQQPVLSKEIMSLIS